MKGKELLPLIRRSLWCERWRRRGVERDQSTTLAMILRSSGRRASKRDVETFGCHSSSIIYVPGAREETGVVEQASR